MLLDTSHAHAIHVCSHLACSLDIDQRARVTSRVTGEGQLESLVLQWHQPLWHQGVVLAAGHVVKPPCLIMVVLAGHLAARDLHIKVVCEVVALCDSGRRAPGCQMLIG